jgi:DNA-binding transcriptional ArsR family regulator
VDLPTLVGETATIEQGVRALLDVPREHLLVEMEWIDRRHRLSPLAWAMAEAGGRPELAEATQVAYQELIQPFWPRIRASLHAEQAARRRTLAAQGPGALLASLQGPLIRWRPPVLEILRPGQVEMELAGRGIALVPSVFVGRAPSLHENPNDEDEMPRLILPAEDARSALLWAPSRSRGPALAALVGRNRAAVLQSIADGCTTTELARRVGISLAAASQHASVLRGAGLIATRRQGSAVLHVLTPLGAELLQAGLGPGKGRAWCDAASGAPAVVWYRNLLPRNRTRLRVDHRLWFPSSGSPAGGAGAKPFNQALNLQAGHGLTEHTKLNQDR